jgi:hypothetical protein
MNMRKGLTLASIIAALCSPVAFSAVAGKKLDSGLGDLSPGYTAAEFPDAGGLIGAVRELDKPGHHVVGEKLDSGLGDLSPGYTAAEFPDAGGLIGAVRDLGEHAHSVAGEKLDSGLGDLSPSYTAAEFQRKDQLARR